MQDLRTCNTLRRLLDLHIKLNTTVGTGLFHNHQLNGSESKPQVSSLSSQAKLYFTRFGKE